LASDVDILASVKIALRLTVALLSLAAIVGVTVGEVTADESASAFSRQVSVSEQAQRQTRPVRQIPAERSATIISDSAMAGIRWNGALGGFRGFNADDRLESCRRLVRTSCSGREGVRPRTALNEVRSLQPAQPTDVLIIAVGYNDWHVGFGWQSRTILDAARAKGFRTVAWVTYRESLGYTLPGDSLVDQSHYAFMNSELRSILASGDYPELRLWDLDGYTGGVAGWFAADGVHQLRRGSWGVADWISRHMAALDGRPCPMPWTLLATLDLVCPNPDPLAYVRGWPNISGLYGV
jgi:hypothetical protein